MGKKLIEGDDGLPAEEVGVWAKKKHDQLCRYLDISHAVRAKWIGKAGATYIDLYCGPGRCRVKETGEWINGGAVAAWEKSREGRTPFTQLFIGDLDEQRREATATRLHQLGAPVVEVTGPAIEAVQQVIQKLNPDGLHFAFLDPFNLKALDFRIIQTLSTLKRIDILVHVNQMDLQRNLVTNLESEQSAFDTFAPGWRDKIDTAQGLQTIRQEVFQYWRYLVADRGMWPSTQMTLIRGSNNQPLYWLLLAAKHELAHKFWEVASNTDRQKKLDF